MDRMLSVGLVTVVSALLACKEGSSSTEQPTSSASTQAPATAATRPPTTPADPTPPTDVKPVLTAGRSAMPTLNEWNTLQREVTVKGSSALKCETKIIREYLRVSCRGENDSGGTPTAVKIVRGGREALTYASAGVASVIVPFVEGTDFAADFSWTDKSHRLTVQWAKGAPKPIIVGVFEGAKSPLDGTAEGDMKKLCECHQKLLKVDSCDDLLGAPDPDCDRTYGNNCEDLLACARGEPARPPRCLPGFLNAGAIMRCMKVCGPGGSCPAGQVCVSDWSSQPVCMSE